MTNDQLTAITFQTICEIDRNLLDPTKEILQRKFAKRNIVIGDDRLNHIIADLCESGTIIRQAFEGSHGVMIYRPTERVFV